MQERMGGMTPMYRSEVNRRQLLAAGLVSAVGLLSSDGSLAEAGHQPTKLIETSFGSVRGLRSNGVSRFLGIPYGSDTGTHRFLVAHPPQPWTGVRDCFSFG